MKLLLAEVGKKSGELRDRYHRILNLVEEKNPGAVAEMIKEDRKMQSVFMDILAPQINEKIQESVAAAVAAERKAAQEAAEKAAQEAQESTKKLLLYECVQEGALTVDYAAKKEGVDCGAFLAAMRSAGYTVPV